MRGTKTGGGKEQGVGLIQVFFRFGVLAVAGQHPRQCVDEDGAGRMSGWERLVQVRNAEAGMAFGFLPFAGIAQRLGRSLADFEKVLQSNGIDVESFRARVKADVAWQQYLTANPSHFAIRDADLVAAMTARGQNLQGKAVQYTMQQVIFVTRRNAPPAVRQERIKQAEALRARVSSCEQAVQLSREYQETVVKPRVRRFSTDLSANLQKLLETLPDGKMTPPEPTANGIEVGAICDRKVIASDISANRELKNELMGQRLQAYEKKVLDQARAKSIIQIISQ